MPLPDEEEKKGRDVGFDSSQFDEAAAKRRLQ